MTVKYLKDVFTMLTIVSAIKAHYCRLENLPISLC